MFFSIINKNSNWQILTKNLIIFKKIRWGWRIKNFNIFGVQWKIQFLGKAHEKPTFMIYRGDCMKRGLGQFVDLMGRGLGKKEGVVLLHVCVCGGASTIRIFSNFANAIGHNTLDKNHLGEISLKILFGPNVSLYFRIGSKDFFQTLQHDRPQ